MEKQFFRQEYRLFMLRARLCKAYEEGNEALALRLSRRMDVYQRRLWKARKRELEKERVVAIESKRDWPAPSWNTFP